MERNRSWRSTSVACALVCLAAVASWLGCDNTGGILGAPTMFESVSGGQFDIIDYTITPNDFDALLVDADQDGDLDIAFHAQASAGSEETFLFRRGGNEYVAELLSTDSMYGSGFLPFAFDGNGVPDLKLGGALLKGDGQSYTFDFTTIPAEGTARGDYDNDGDDDLATGASGVSIWENQGGSGATTWISSGTRQAVWFDYDGDGDLDLAAGANGITVYRNDAGTLAMIWNEPGWMSSLFCFDVDGDGVPEVVGRTDAWLRVCTYSGGAWSSATTTLNASLWPAERDRGCGDFDNDGDTDIVAAGTRDSRPHLFVIDNAGGSFTVRSAEVDLRGTGTTIGDYDGDGDLDVVAAGIRLGLYRNNCSRSNAGPSAPANLDVNVAAGVATFTWDPAVDDRTPQPALTYNMRVWTDDGSTIDEIMPAHAGPISGKRYFAAPGNCWHAGAPGDATRSWWLDLPAGTYHWSVQAIDTSFVGGPWALGAVFLVP